MIFDSGSSCSVVKEDLFNAFRGTMCNNIVYLRGIGSDDIKCISLVCSKIKIGEVPTDLLFYMVPDGSMSEPVIIGRDILENSVSVKIDNGSLEFYYKEHSNVCDTVPNESDLKKTIRV